MFWLWIWKQKVSIILTKRVSTAFPLKDFKLSKKKKRWKKVVMTFDLKHSINNSNHRCFDWVSFKGTTYYHKWPLWCLYFKIKSGKTSANIFVLKHRVINNSNQRCFDWVSFKGLKLWAAPCPRQIMHMLGLDELLPQYIDKTVIL